MVKAQKKIERNNMVKKEKKLEVEAEAKPETETEPQEVKEIKPANTQPKVTKVGTLLKNMRQEKGLKIVEIAKKLCIRKQYLEAIEESNYAEVPPFPYGTGFIRSYADFLGLNSSNIVELYKEETTEKKPVIVNLTKTQTKSAMPNGIYVLASLIALGVLYGAWTMWNNGDDEIDPVSNEQVNENDELVVFEELTMPQQNENDIKVSDAVLEEEITVTVTEETPQESVAETPVTEVKNEEKIETTASEVKSESQDTEVKVQNTVVVPERGVFIEVLEETWIEVRNESKLYISKVLQPGASYTLPNDKGLILSVGKLGGVNVYVNGKKTDIARIGRKMNIDIDSYLNSNH